MLPQSDALPNTKRMKEEWHPSTGPTMQGIVEEKHTEVDPEEYEYYGQEDGDDEDEDYDEEEEDEEDYGDYGDYDEEEVDPFDAEDALREAMKHKPEQDMRFFRVGDKLREKYSTNEIDSFIKLLDTTTQCAIIELIFCVLRLKHICMCLEFH